MFLIADLELHSKYARAVSSSMNLSTIALWASKKGIGLVGTGDFTHPMWFREIEISLVPSGEGVYKLKPGILGQDLEVRFILTTEVSCIYQDKGKVRRVHLMVYLPTTHDVRKFNSELTRAGANLFSDGRPIIGLSLYQVAQIALEVNPKALIIPAHVWTPWYGFYGSESGYDSLDEAFDDLSKNIFAVETGLSSDPAMNWKITELENRKIVSFGDAHSPQKLGREATVFELKEEKIGDDRFKISYDDIYQAIKEDKPTNCRIGFTIEFYPEEGKYHYTGHRKCKVIYSPSEARKMGLTCPVCGKSLTLGVSSRVESLAGQEIEVKFKTDEFGVRWVWDKNEKKFPYIMLVPLLEILSEALGVGVVTKAVVETYEKMISQFCSEFNILLWTKIEEVEEKFGKRIAEGIRKVRSGDIFIKPGYDGVFGEVKIWRSEQEIPFESSVGQRTLF